MAAISRAYSIPTAKPLRLLMEKAIRGLVYRAKRGDVEAVRALAGFLLAHEFLRLARRLWYGAARQG
jgi:hypothetical protein